VTEAGIAATHVGWVTPGMTMLHATEYVLSSTVAGPIGTPVTVISALVPGVTSNRFVTVLLPVTVTSTQSTSLGTDMSAKVS
jgi:hypothetical protein